MPILLGAVADDFTGATDLCNTLVKGGMRTVQAIGVPPEGLLDPGGRRGRGGAEVAHHPGRRRRWPSRSRRSPGCGGPGARQILFKYCSTFDFTDAGNIGPVADALLEALGSDFTIDCPAFPENGRTIYCGHLFVGDVLLSDTHMRDHPLTPMTRQPTWSGVLARQTPAQGRPRALGRDRGRGRRGARRVRHAAGGRRAARHRRRRRGRPPAHARRGLRRPPLVTGGSGIALGLPDNFRAAGLLQAGAAAGRAPARRRASPPCVSGSCSAATLRPDRGDSRRGTRR